MIDRRHSPYHIGEQEAEALLPPIEATLAELQARLTQYVERLHLSDADRARVAEARDSVAATRDQVARILAGPRDSET